ncbi:lectin, partial [Kibdelosporangium lantanae]
SQPLHAALATVDTDYTALRSRHTAIHTAWYDRSRLDLDVSAADRRLSVSELITRQNNNQSVIDIALLERLYDSGRYLFISSSGILPPRLTGIWTGTWTGAWADDFTTDANINLQVAGGNILDTTEAMQGYFTLVLGQLAQWRTNARNLYGARGFLAPSRTDGEYGHMLHFDTGFPGQTWTGGADWLLYPLVEYWEVTGDQAFLRDKLGPALIELALFYEDFLTRTDSGGKVVWAVLSLC